MGEVFLWIEENLEKPPSIAIAERKKRNLAGGSGMKTAAWHHFGCML